MGLTLSGNEITDAVRNAGVQGDGLTPPAGVGIWPATTNLIQDSTPSSSMLGWSVAANCTLVYDTTKFKFGAGSGLVTASGSGTASATIVAASGSRIAVTGSTTYSLSVWGLMKTSTARQPYVFVRWFTSGGTFISDTSGSLPAGTIATGAFAEIQAPGLVAPSNAALAEVRVGLANAATSDAAWFAGAQLEPSAFCTPLIYTNGSTASRGAARVQAPASLINATQFAVAFAVRMGRPSSSVGSGASAYLFEWRNPTGNQDGYQLRWRNDSTSWRLDSTVGGVATDASQADASWNTGDIRIVVATATDSELLVSVNGAPPATATVSSSPSLSSVTSFDIGSDQIFGIGEFGGEILWTVAASAFTTGDIATLNGWYTTPPTAAQVGTLSDTAQVTALWPAVTAEIDPPLSRVSPISHTLPILV